MTKYTQTTLELNLKELNTILDFSDIILELTKDIDNQDVLDILGAIREEDYSFLESAYHLFIKRV